MNFELETRALIFATIAHKGQERKSTKLPYIIHPIRVVGYLIQSVVIPVDNYAVAVGYLHDVLEDTNYKLDMFPKDVQTMVEYLTKREGEDKIQAILKINSAPQIMKPTLFMIKMADRYDNCFGDDGVFREKYIKKKSTIDSTRLLLQYAKDNWLGDEQIYKELQELFKEKQ